MIDGSSVTRAVIVLVFISILEILGWPQGEMSSVLSLPEVNTKVTLEDHSLCHRFITINLLYRGECFGFWLSQIKAEFDRVPLLYF